MMSWLVETLPAMLAFCAGNQLTIALTKVQKYGPQTISFCDHQKSFYCYSRRHHVHVSRDWCSEESLSRNKKWLDVTFWSKHVRFLPCASVTVHDDVIKWKHFPRYSPFVWGNSPVNGEFSTQSSVTRNLMFSFICAWTSCWVNKGDADNLRRYRSHCDAIVMSLGCLHH